MTWNLRRTAFVAALATAMVGLLGAAGWAMFALDKPVSSGTVSAAPSPSGLASAIQGPAASPSSASPSTSPSATSPVAPVPAAVAGKLLFGIGDEADRDAQFALTRQAPVKMLTSWYDRPADLTEFMNGWKGSLIPKLYKQGYAMHVVEWTPEVETTFSSRYGSACGRAYPLSAQFLTDLKQVAQIFAGPASGPPLYVTLFTEFSTYPCVDNEWDSATNYYLALKDQYRAAYQVLHANAPNVHVSLGFGGWLGTYDYPQKHGGRSLLAKFTDIMKMSDFQSFQAMNDGTNMNPSQIKAMVNILHPYGPVMLAHYKPDNGNQSTFNSDVRAIFTDSYIKEITAAGLFAMSFMTNDNPNADLAFVKAAVTRYGSSP